MATRSEAIAIARDAELDGRWGDAVRVRLQAAIDFPNPDAPRKPIAAAKDWYETPFGNGAEFGPHISLDGVSVAGLEQFSIAMIARVIAKGVEPTLSCAIVELADGRWIAWESLHGEVTGSGFHSDWRGDDIVGGDAQIGVASTPGPCLEYLSERARETLVWA